MIVVVRRISVRGLALFHALSRIPQTIVKGTALVLFLVAALAIRLHEITDPWAFDLDEGVYWQSLRLMQQGYCVYREIYVSQAPMFLAIASLPFAVFGSSIFAARLSMTLASLVGLLGGFLIGRAAIGFAGGLAVMVLLETSSPYLAMSETLQAEAPAIGFSVLAVGLAFVAARHVSRKLMAAYAIAAGACFAIAVCSKLLAVSALAPIVMCYFLGDRLGSKLDSVRRTFFLSLASIVGGVGVALILVLYFSSDLHNLWTQVISYHLTAANVYRATRATNFSLIREELFSPIGLAAAIGTVYAYLQRNQKIWPILAWFIASLAMLVLLAPLFRHHLVALEAPLCCLGAFMLSPMKSEETATRIKCWYRVGGILLLLVTAAIGVDGEMRSSQDMFYREVYGSDRSTDQRVVRALRKSVPVGSEVVSDAQFLVASAGRDTPPWLVDTTLVRANSGQLTLDELIAGSEPDRVRGILFFGNRLARFPAYHVWVSNHFRLVGRFGMNDELWVR